MLYEVITDRAQRGGGEQAHQTFDPVGQHDAHPVAGDDALGPERQVFVQADGEERSAVVVERKGDALHVRYEDGTTAWTSWTGSVV